MNETKKVNEISSKKNFGEYSKKIHRRSDKAITLIALVIIIIILLILAGITISQLNNSGLFDKSKQAKEKYQNAQEKEDTEIAKYSNEIDSYVDGNRDTVTIDKDEFDELKAKVTTLENIQDLSSGFNINYIKGNKKYLTKAGKTVQLEINGDNGCTTIPSNQIVTMATGLPKCAIPIQELTIRMDWVAEYARCWIDKNGTLCLYTSATNYTGNIFIGGTYITNE